MNILRPKSKTKSPVRGVSVEIIRDHNLPTTLSPEDLVCLNLVHARITSTVSAWDPERRSLLEFDVIFNSPETRTTEVSLSEGALAAKQNDTSFSKLEKDLKELVARFGPTNALKTISIKCTFPLSQLQTVESVPTLKTQGDVESGDNITSPLNKEIAPLSSIMPLWQLQDIVLPIDTKRQLEIGIARIRFKGKLLDEWNLKSIFPSYGSFLNLHGPPGTGKTMTGHAVAQSLGMKILRVTPAQIESKYVGESPKNLFRSFQLAQAENAVLFFDEADSFLGNRIASISQSADQAINSLRSELLNLLDSFNGVVVFATNRISVYDPAFLSRLFHISFKLPDEQSRFVLWQKFLLPELPLGSDIDVFSLAGEFQSVSGRDIRDAVLNAALTVLLENRTQINQGDLIEGMKIRLKETKTQPD